MKFVMSFLVASTFAVPAFAQSVAARNRQDIAVVNEVVTTRVQAQNEEERTRGAGAYRLVPVADPNADTASNAENTFEIKPWFPSVRKMRMTRFEIEQEAMYCQGKPAGCKDVTRIATEDGGIAAGGTIKINLNGAGQ